MANESERFRKYYLIDSITGCWNWTGANSPLGYGLFRFHGRNVGAHRASYQMAHPDFIPASGIDIDHLCRNRGCVNPAHLEAVSHQQICSRGEVGKRNAIKTHCPQGHEYTPENTYLGQVGKRGCKTCRRLARQRQYEKKRSAYVSR